MTRTGPLTGLRVLDLSRLLPGGACTLILADLGADVVKIEEPGRGDYMRWIPPWSDEYGAMFSASNRNKRSMTLDLKHPRAREVLGRLARDADIVVEGFRPGVAARLGAGYEQLSADNPGLVYCSVSGFGQTGPYAARPGHDLNYLAASGLLAMTGTREAPVEPGPQIADVWGGGVTAALAVLAALAGRGITGRGAALDVSMLDGTTFGLANHAPNWLVGRERSERAQLPLSGAAANYAIYPVKDGFVTVADYEEKFWARTCELLGRSDLVDRQNDRGIDADGLRAELVAEFATRTRAEWEEIFSGEDACFMPVLSPEEAIESAHFRDRELVIEVPGEGGPERQLASPLTRMGAGPHVRAPRLGEQTVEVLAAVGYSEQEIAQLRGEGVV